MFGYITVLPGAFSAYRYIALQNNSNGEGPLQKYFLGEKMVRQILIWRDLANFNSMELGPISLRQICTWPRIVYVGNVTECDVAFAHIFAFLRSCAGNSYRNEEEHGSFTMSSLRTVLPTRQIRCVPICLGKGSQLDCPFPRFLS